MYRTPEQIILADGRTLADVYAAHQRWLLTDRRCDDPDRARLDGARLVGASLVGASLVGASLVGASLDGARLVGASLDGARLDRASLVGASLVGASLDGARLDRASLVGASLVGASLDGARLDGASLDRASLVGASLDGARLDGASLDGARLDRASLVGASLVGASLDGARLDGASLDRASLVGASLDGASLESADLSRIEADVRAFADEYATAEVQGLIRALHLGRVNGTCYEPQCGMACLVGTIALVKGVPSGSLRQNSSRLAEVWALSIRPGDSAPANQVATLTAKWLTAAIVERPDYDAAHPFGPTSLDTPLARDGWVVMPADRDPMTRTAAEAEAYALELLAAAQVLRAEGGE